MIRTSHGGSRTEICDGSNVASDLFLCMLPQTSEEVDNQINSTFSRLIFTVSAHLDEPNRSALTGRRGRRGSTADSSRNALGSKNNLNHSHFIVPAMGLAFLASRPQAITLPSSSYNKQVGICKEISRFLTAPKLLANLSERFNGTRPVQNLLYLSTSNTRGTVSLGASIRLKILP